MRPEVRGEASQTDISCVECDKPDDGSALEVLIHFSATRRVSSRQEA